MVALKRTPATDYGLCDRPVTVYHRAGKDVISRRVVPRAFLDSRKAANVEKTGSSEASSFLLVIPGDDPIEAGDKVMPGEGPEIADDAEWREFVPAKVPGLCVVRYVDPKYYGGELAHVEAGG